MSVPALYDLSEKNITRAQSAFIKALGRENVVSDATGLRDFRDPFAFHGPKEARASMAVLPGSVEEVRAVLRIANELKIPLWTVSQGRNNGYGGMAPRVAGSVVVNLRRMNRVLEVNEELAYAIVEPGVRFLDLHEHLAQRGYTVWNSTADLGWGSVLGNTADHGMGYTIYGDHPAAQCGMEVVLADGDVMRTGMGGMTNNGAWVAHPRGLGPSPDRLFMQSNFGIITKMGIWLMRQPEVYRPAVLFLPQREDLVPAIDALRPLMVDRTIGMVPVTLANALSVAGTISKRSDWTNSAEPIPDSTIDAMVQKFGIGHWNGRLAFYGREKVVEANFEAFEDAMSRIKGARIVSQPFAGKDVRRGNIPVEFEIPAGIPNMNLMSLLKWPCEEDGGHMGFAPIIPGRGKEVREAHDFVREITEANGFDLAVGVQLYERSTILVTALLFDASKDEEVSRALETCRTMVREGGKRGYGEYRGHIGYMDLAAAQFDFNGHAQRRFNETIKDALDPNGILSPGKQGIWPKALREQYRPS